MAAGTFTTATLAADDSVLSNLKAGDSFYRCTAAGTVDFFSSKAYGVWEFSYMRALGTGPVTAIRFISQDQLFLSSDDGYTFLVSPLGVLGLSLYVTGTPTELFTTATGYLTIGTWYSIKVDRSDGGTFKVSIKGGDFGDIYTRIVPSSGSNPVNDTTFTNSIYMVFSLGVGDGFLWTPDERTTSVGGTQYGVNPLILPVPNTTNAVSLTV